MNLTKKTRKLVMKSLRGAQHSAIQALEYGEVRKKTWRSFSEIPTVNLSCLPFGTSSSSFATQTKKTVQSSLINLPSPRLPRHHHRFGKRTGQSNKLLTDRLLHMMLREGAEQIDRIQQQVHTARIDLQSSFKEEKKLDLVVPSRKDLCDFEY